MVLCKNISIGRFNKTKRLVVTDSVMEEISLLNTNVLLLEIICVFQVLMFSLKYPNHF